MYRVRKRNVVSTAMGLMLSFLAVTVYAAECRTATPGAAQWQNAPMPPVQNYGYHTQPGMYSVEFTVSPEIAGGDTLVALSQGPQTTWSKLATIVRFNTNNTVDVRDGGVYRADAVFTYEPQNKYYVRMEVNVYAHTYSVFVRPGFYEDFAMGGTQIAKDYAFRTEQQGVTTLDNVVFEAETGALSGCAEATKPMLGPVPGGPAQWQNAGLPPSYGISRAVTFDVEPLTANGDTLVALTKGPQTNWANLPMIVRFNSNNTIDVRDGDVYRADTVVPYLPEQHYRVTILFQQNFSGQPSSYSVYVAPPGGESQLIARNYRLRTGFDYLSEISNWTAEAEVGAIRVRYMWHRNYY